MNANQDRRSHSAPRAIIYTRVSTGGQAEHGTSLASQEVGCREKAEELGMVVIEHYKDPGVSGSLYHRPGIQSALRDIEEKKAEALIIYNLDRSGRDVDVIRLIQKRVTDAGGQLIFANGMQFENNATGKLMLTQLAGFAEFEHALIRERTIIGRRNLASKGITPTRTVSPYGYHIVTKEDVLLGMYPHDTLGSYQVIEEQARWVKLIFSRFAAGNSLREVARFLEEQHVSTPRGALFWLPTTLRSILGNSVYKGILFWGRMESLKDESRILQGLKSPIYNRPRPDDECIPIRTPVIVDDKTWQACQDRLKENKQLKSGNPERRYLLSGLIHCPNCRFNLVGDTRRTYRGEYYRCPRKQRCSHRKNHPARNIEVGVIHTLAHIARNPELIHHALRVYKEEFLQNDVSQDRHRLERELDQVRSKENATVRIQVDAASKGRDITRYDALLDELDRKRKDLEIDLEALGPVQDVRIPDMTVLTDQVSRYLEDMETVLLDETISRHQRREILSTVVKEIIPGDKGFEMRLADFWMTETVHETVVYCRPEALAAPGEAVTQLMQGMRQMPIRIEPDRRRNAGDQR